jgi:transposase
MTRDLTLVSDNHGLLVMAYYILTRREPCLDLGANSFDERDRQAVERRLVHRLEALGYTVSLQPPDSVA